MKVRIGIGVSRDVTHPEQLAALGADIVSTGFDSIWLSDILFGGGMDPIVGLSYLAAAVPSLKLGTTMLLPGRNPARLAKTLATLDRLSAGKLSVTFVPGLSHGAERTAIGVSPKERGAAMDELLPIVRQLLTGEIVTYQGQAGPVVATLRQPRPVQEPLEFWLGGMAPRALERCGHFGDGWLPSFCSPAQAIKGKSVIEATAARFERTIDPEHFGVSLTYARSSLSEDEIRSFERLARDEDPRTLIPVGPEQLRSLIDDFVAGGISKFVLRPLAPPTDWRSELETLASDVGDMQT